jgi:hypothetical protein
MAKLAHPPKSTLLRDLPFKDKMKLALDFLHENPHEKPSTAARLYDIKQEDSVRKAWLRERKGKKARGGQNKILRPDQHQALIRYAVDQAINGGKGATKQMMYNCAMWLRVQEHKPVPTWRWFNSWLKSTTELHTIKTKPIASHRVDMHTEKHLREWFETEYKPALEYTQIKSGKYIHNMDEKGAQIACPAGEEVVVPIGIKEMYIGVPENRLSVTIVESISADGKAIPPLVIIPGVTIMVSWFHENMTGLEVVTVSPTGYTNEGICMTWLDHFIKHNNCGLDKPWHILLIDGATCHEAPNFVLKAKMNHIWVVKFPSHQTHLIQPLDVGCFRTWKHYQQSTIMNAIRSFEPEYNVQSFLRDLPKIREKTFTVRTIKHSFQNAGVWPMSFKAVKKKLKEYGKKKKRDTGLDFLEYGSESESESETERELDPVPDPQLEEEYQLPQLKPPSSYDECRFQLQDLDPKITVAVSSPTRERYRITITATNTFLMRGSLHEMEIKQARAGQVETHKRKLEARKSLGKGGSLLASDALQKIKIKRRKEADDVLRKAKTAITRVENKAKNELNAIGIKARKDEKARLLLIQQHQALGISIPDHLWIPIRDPEKQPTLAERDALRANQSLYDAVETAQAEWDRVHSENPLVFTDIPIDPAILEAERQFQIQQTPGLHIDVEEEGSGSDGEGGSDLASTPRSVISIDSIAENADFVSLE